MKILVTGISGFIGNHLSKRLLKDGHKVFTILRDPALKDKYEKRNITCLVDNNPITDLIEFFEKEHLDGVIHCASCFVVEHKPEEINELITSNILFSTKLLESSIKTKVKWFVNTGTFWQHYENNVYSPVNLYAATKQAFESIAKYYMEISNINFVTVKLSDTYGPNDTRPKIFNLWKKIAETGENIGMSPGEQYIDIVYIDDVVGAYVRMVELLKEDNQKSFKGKSFAVSSGNLIKLKDLAEVFEKLASCKLKIKWGQRPYREREVMTPWSDGIKIPGWSPKVSIEEGIAKLLRYRKIEI